MRIFPQRNRPLHLGKYPMEKIKRAKVPTTKISNEVPRVPQRANFFMRARWGDLGPKAKEELPRFVHKSPFSAAMGEMMQSQLSLHEGEVADEQASLPEDPQEWANHLKAMCYFLDASIVGICEIPDYAWYSHDAKGNPIEAQHQYAIVILIDQGYETLEGSSGDDWISSSQSFRAYLKGSTIACTVTQYLNKLGHDARAHSNADSQVLHLPLTLLAGLGELSRIGELVLNPFLGPRFKTSVITTNLPLVVDQPIDFGLQDFCNKCMKCARECPCAAISFGNKVMFNGYEMWKPDVNACTRYRVMNPNGSACGRCMKMCPFNKQDLLQYRIALWLAIKFPALRRLLVWLDDAMEFGKRNPVWKWWFDLETREGKVIQPKKTNERNLNLERKPPAKQNIAVYPAASNPPPNSQEPHLVKRTTSRGSD